MSTPLVVSVTDELIAELERECADNPQGFMAETEYVLRLLAERAELLRDACRYQALRKMHWSDSKLSVVADPKNNVKLGADCQSLERLDEAIDAAMQSEANP